MTTNSLSLAIQRPSMKVSVDITQTEITAAHLQRDPNYDFLQQVTLRKKEQRSVNFEQLQAKLKIIGEKLALLSLQEREEWQLTLYNKARQILQRYKRTRNLQSALTNGVLLSINLAKSLRETFFTLVMLCVENEIQYDSKRVEQLIKSFYYMEYGQQIVFAFDGAGYDTFGYNLFYMKRKSPLKCCQITIDKEIEIID